MDDSMTSLVKHISQAPGVALTAMGGVVLLGLAWVLTAAATGGTFRARWGSFRVTVDYDDEEQADE